MGSSALVPPGLGAAHAADRASQLRRALEDGSSTLVVPGVVDALGARLVERAGFEASYLTGAGVANTTLGLADVGIVSLSETTERAARVADATRLPLIVDADTGYGGPMAVMRTVHLLEMAGVAAIQLEDQAMPKRCGHFDGKRLVDVEEMVAKIMAAVRARSGDLIVVARTDARAVEGLEAAIERARRYRDAGADVLFVEAPTSEAELERVATALSDMPLVANVVEGGRTPELPVKTLAAMGYRIVLHANLLMRVMVYAAEQALDHLVSEGETRSLHDRMISWDHRQQLVQLAEMDELEDELRSQARMLLAVAHSEAHSTDAGESERASS